MEDDNKGITPEKVHCPVTPYDWLRTTYRTVTVCNISDIYPVMGMPAMCSIPHHIPRHRKGWTTACKPSSSLFSCYSFQPYILIVHGVWTHFSSPISSLFPGYGLIFPAPYPHCSSPIYSLFPWYGLIVPGIWPHCLVRAGLHVAMSSDSCECSLPLALTRQSSEPVSPSSTYKPVIQCQ